VSGMRSDECWGNVRDMWIKKHRHVTRLVVAEKEIK